MRFFLYLAASLLAPALLPLVGQNLPNGFVLEALVPSGIHVPTAIAELPDGRWLVCEKGGNIKLIAAGAATQVGSVVTMGVSEQGLLGIAIDPLWPQAPYVYLFHTTLVGSCHLIRMTASGDLDQASSSNLSLGSSYLLIDDIPDADIIHQAGCLRFGPDGMLYLSSGDDHDECSAQDVESLLGCILRLNIASVRGAQGAGPPSKSLLAAPGNPFSGPNSQLVWAFGLRNPWRFCIDGDDLYVADVGAANYEEVSRISGGGANLGWPYREGPAPHSNPCFSGSGGYLPPLHSWIHGSGGFAACIFGGVYRNRPGQPFNFGPAYEGDLFISDLAQGWVRRLELSGAGATVAPPVPGQPDPVSWASGLIRAVDVVEAQDGSLVMAIMAPPLVGIHRLRPLITPHLAVESGDMARGIAGRLLDQPLSLRAFDAMGAPVSGVAVTFQMSAGAGSFSTPLVVTDAAGRASTDFTPGVSSSVDGVVVASAPGYGNATFTIAWRGLQADYLPGSATLELLVRGAGAQAGITLAADVPPPAPLAFLSWGPLWTSIAAPASTLLIMDGLGVVGPILPGMEADPQGDWSLSLPSLPSLGGLSLVFQAYAVDPGLFPSDEAILITNEVFLTLP